jgi:MFS family permease
MLLRGANGWRSLVLCGGVALHAINLYVAATILPSVVRDIGGIDFYAWNTSLFVVGSILGAAASGAALHRFAPGRAYALASLVFAAGSAVCAIAPVMPVLIAGRVVQGLGGGMLLALPYAMIRIAFEPVLWPRAMALISGMWGLATLLGPAFGGALADLGAWRLAFGALAPLAILFAAIAMRTLPAEISRTGGVSLPRIQLVLLCSAVLVVSLGSVAPGIAGQAAGLIAGLALLVRLAHVERSARVRLLPHGAMRPAHPLGALYATMALLAVTVTCSEVFVPLFLQELHALGPFAAGVLAAVMSAGWTAGSIAVSGAGASGAARLLRSAPWLAAAGMLLLMLLVPEGGGSDWRTLALIVAALILVGLAVGLAWPHLATLVMRTAPEEEADLASSSIMTVQLVATAMSTAVAGIVLNLAGIGEPGGAASASRWLFGLFAVAPLLSVCIPVRPQT